jgi:hypothetical protein
MKKIVVIQIILILSISIKFLSAEPLEKLIRDYAQEFTMASQELKEIAEKINYGKEVIVRKKINHYPYYEIIGVLKSGEVEEVIKSGKLILVRKGGERFEDEILFIPEGVEFKLVVERLTRRLNALLPEFSKIEKNLRIDEDFINEKTFLKEVNSFKDHSQLIIKIAKYKNIPDSLTLPDKLIHYGKWKNLQDSISKLSIEKSLKAFEQKYGENAEKNNLFELFCVNYIPVFRGNINGPSKFEPIIRVSPIIYNFEGGNIFPMVQVGFNYYFLGENNFLLNLIHHVGIAACTADIENNQFYKIEKISFGGMVHIGKFELGVMRDNREENWNIISTVDFQVLKGLF